MDDTILRIPNLWREDGTPTPASALAPQLVPVRHPPAPDVHEATLNSALREWLAVFAPDWGGVRLTFESPASAHAFADWLRATRSTQLGSYELRIFRQANRRGGRPFGSLTEEAMQTLRPLTAEDLPALTVGPVGEP